ncbi:hypothetical protein [Leisingera sp. JC1]|nr:hypothetical protein [Leisingera sp. JC1]
MTYGFGAAVAFDANIRPHLWPVNNPAGGSSRLLKKSALDAV